ncbi:MAG TPA: recombinase family protein [Bacteroidia bacterium]
MKPNKNIGIWIRVSTEDQARGESPEHHEERARAYSKINDWDIYTVYHLEGVSGKSVMSHPEAIRMMNDIKSGAISGLIFSKLARLARSTKELLEFSEFFRQNNADLISLQEKIDTSTPAGRLFYTVIAAMAQWEREEIADRVSASVPIRARLGKPLGGAAPYGYMWDNGILKIDPKEAPIRKKIYDYFLEVKRRKHVAKRLNDEGYRTRNGSMFSDTTIHRLLRDPIAKGLKRANYTKSRGDGKAWDIKPQESWVLTEAPAIISEDIWQKCNDILDEIALKNRRPTKVVTHLFGGLTLCSCGGKMYVKSNNKKYVCQKCQNKIVTDDLEEIFYTELKTYLESESEISKYTSDIQNLTIDKKNLLIGLRNDISGINQKLQNLLDLHEKDEIPTEGFKAHYMPLFTQLGQKESYLAQVEGEIDALEMQSRSTDSVFSEAKELHSDWKNKSRNEKRAIIEDITESILIGNEDIEITLKGVPRNLSSELVAKGQYNLRGSYLQPT